MVYELPKKPVQLIGIFALCINEFNLLAEIIPCDKVEALSTLQIQACNFLQKYGMIPELHIQNYTYIPFASSGTGGFPEYKWVYLEVLHKKL